MRTTKWTVAVASMATTLGTHAADSTSKTPAAQDEQLDEVVVFGAARN